MKGLILINLVIHNLFNGEPDYDLISFKFLIFGDLPGCGIVNHDKQKNEYSHEHLSSKINKCQKTSYCKD